MTKTHGMGDRLYINGNDLSGDMNTVDISSPVTVFNTTHANKDGNERATSTVDGKMHFMAFFNPARAHPVLKVLPTFDIPITYLRGIAAQTVGAGSVAKQVNYDPARGSDGSLLFSVDAVTDGTSIEWGKDYVGAATRLDTAATNGAGVDDGATTTAGFTAYLHAFSFTGTSVTVSLQHSNDNGVSDAWATFLSFTAVTAGATAQRVTAPGIIKRWVRAITTGAFSSFLFHVLGIRIFGATVAVDIQTFASSGTWARPSGGQTATMVIQISGGAGGGSGSRRASGAAHTGGGGGGGGGYNVTVFRTADLAATETVTIGAGGPGGATRTTDNSNGNSGTNGGDTTFGTSVIKAAAVGAVPGDGGSSGGTSASGGVGGTGTTDGSAGGTSTGIGGIGNAGGFSSAAAGGGAGGGISAGNTPNAGGDGGLGLQLYAGFFSNAGGGVGAAGGDATNAPANLCIGADGGGGGGASTAAAGGRGGNGAIPGGGGGGGGASNNGQNSGAGGNGAIGMTQVVSW